MNIVFSGFKDNVLKIQLEKKGYIIQNITNKNTQLVIVKDPDRPITICSAKVKRALALKIPIISRQKFITKLIEFPRSLPTSTFGFYPIV